MFTVQKNAPVVTALAVLLTATIARAHAQLDHASPVVGSTVDAPPARVQIWFDQDVNPAGTSIQVFDASGKQIDLKDSKPDPADKTLMAVSLPPSLPAGSYTVKWNALCIDNHKTQGDFKFTVERKK